MQITHEQISDGLDRALYVTNERVETAIFLALGREKPLLIEGPAGAGKTEVAKVLAEILHTELIRLQCYEGLDEARALEEWNYQKQLLRMQADEQQGIRWEELSEHIFSRVFLLERPLLKAITSPSRVVLLIDEVDKADEEFEAFLLELLSDFQVSVPELGTLKARERPVVILTSNRARELSEALRRRCLHLFIDFPGSEQERKIIELKVPELDAKLAAEAARFVGAIRKLGLRKPPSIAETLDWARANSTPTRCAPRWASCSSTKTIAPRWNRKPRRSRRVVNPRRRSMPRLRDQLVSFIAALREAGVRISVAESIDAMNAVAAVGLERARMHEALAAALIKDEADRAIFDEAFNRFFAVPRAHRGEHPDQRGDQISAAAGRGRPGEDPSPRDDAPPRKSEAPRDRAGASDRDEKSSPSDAKPSKKTRTAHRD